MKCFELSLMFVIWKTIWSIFHFKIFSSNELSFMYTGDSRIGWKSIWFKESFQVFANFFFRFSKVLLHFKVNFFLKKSVENFLQLIIVNFFVKFDWDILILISLRMFACLHFFSNHSQLTKLSNFLMSANRPRRDIHSKTNENQAQQINNC